jgi:protein AroM
VTLGLVTIGQSPRVDVLPDLLPALAGRAWVEHGALDLATASVLADIAPREGEVPLVSRMRDGSRASMVHERVLPLVAEAVERCAADGADAVLLMCTGHFEPFATSIPVYAAEPLAQEAIVRTAEPGFGVINPVADQLDEARARWQARAGHPVPSAAADPYTAPLAEIADAGRLLAAQGATSIVLDCFGYSATMADAVRRATNLPVHLTRLVATEAALAAIDGAPLPDGATQSTR